jgi:hypothetical protein
MELNDSLVFWHRVPFGNEGCSHCRFGEFVELGMSKSSQDTALADSTVAHCDCLYLEDWLFAHSLLIINYKSDLLSLLDNYIIYHAILRFSCFDLFF